MSEARYHNLGNYPAVKRVPDKFRTQFPSWVSANEVRDATIGSKSVRSEFLLASNWVLLQGGLQEFVNELKKNVEDIDVIYDLETASVKVKCLTSREEAVMAVCQSIMDKIVQDELDRDRLAASKIIAAMDWHASEQHQKESLMVLAPQGIQKSTYQTAWIIPGNLVKKDIGALELVSGEALAELQLLASCEMVAGNDGLVIYIAAESKDNIAVAERKLNTLAKYAAMPSRADTLCEAFIYAEDKKDSLATFTYVAHGPKTMLKNFFLDRAKYTLAKESSAYGRIFEKGVFVTLLSGHSRRPTIVTVDLTPAISSGDKKGCFKAFSPAWRYRPKHEFCGPSYADTIPASSSSNLDPNKNVTSWITRLPRPEMMLPHGDRHGAPDLGLRAHIGRSQEPITGHNLINTAREQTPGHRGYPVINRTDQAPSGSSWGEIRRVDPHSAWGGLSEQQEQTTSQSNLSTVPRETGKNPQKKKHKAGKKHRAAKHRGQKHRGEQLNANSSSDGGRQADQMIPYIQRAGIRNTNNHEPRPVSYVPPHLRGLGTSDQTREITESSEYTLNAPETNLTESDANELGSQQKAREHEAYVDDVVEETKTLQLQDEGAQPIQPRSAPADLFGSACDRFQAQRATMRQRAPLPSSRGHAQATDSTSSDEILDLGSDLVLMQVMSQKLVRMMSSLEVFRGRVSLKAEFGRLCLTTINHNHVHVHGSAARSPAKSLREMKEALDKHHVNPRDVMFTNILTAEGEDANYISFMQDSFGKRMWLPDTRRTVYEVACCAFTKEKKPYRFVVEIDGGDFTYQIRQLQGNSCTLFVHCPNRAWDFQVTVSKTPNLDEIYGNFAKDLVDSMRVIPQDFGVPLVEFTVKRAYRVELLLVRIRNIASYKRKIGAFSSPDGTSPDSNILEICEVHDMAPLELVETKDQVTVPFRQHPGFQQLGQLPTWYEVSIQSKLVNKAVQQNRNLELGEEVDWSPEQLWDAGAFDGLIQSATDMVKKIDGVGYWGDNYQDAMIHGVPPAGPVPSSPYWAALDSLKEPW
ncbi:hypothetical protein M434DRAFT_383882 [Hypoxylon sp. CO27-5]|nr:hypothetical protein M434DRAFT_383882 [Hypoxylon sp. CO27-5]